jgi:4-amino-4-deoxy-L-arabinose transferase-like glycosyltransferase
MSVDETVSNHPESPAHHGFRWHVAVLLLILVFFGVVRWRLAGMPLERDEGEYAYAGQLLLQGIPPYQFAYNMKLPGTYAAYAVLMAVLGQTPQGIHLGLLLVNAATVVLIYFLAAGLFGTLAGTVAAATYALLSTHQSTLGFAAHATHFVVLAAIAGLLLLLRADERGKLSTFFGSGLLFGLAFLMKQPGIFLGAFAFLYLIFVHWRRPGVDWARLGQQAAVFLIGCASPFVLTCILLWRAGVFKNFWFWTFSYARQYASLVSVKDGWELFTYHVGPILGAAPGVWIIALIGLTALLWHPPARRHAVLIVGLFVFSSLAVSAGLYFRSHYFVLVLPAIALLAGIGVAAAVSLLDAKQVHPLIRMLPVIVFVLACGWAIRKSANYYFELSPLQACRKTYGLNSPFPEALPIAAYLREHTAPTDRIIVLGSEPEIYFYAHRLSASGYIYVYGLMENQPYWTEMQKQMIGEIEANRPAYLVYVNDPASWLTTMGSSRVAPLLDWANPYVKSHYEKVGLVELAEPESRYVWGDQARSTRPQAQYQVSIFKRKE